MQKLMRLLLVAALGLFGGTPVRAAPSGQQAITFLGVFQNGKPSDELGDAVVQRLRRLGETVEPHGFALTAEEQGCSGPSCVEWTARRHNTRRLLQGRVGPSDKPDALRVQLFFAPSPDQNVRWQDALCTACSERQLSALVASLTGRLLDGAPGAWLPVKAPEVDAPAEPKPAPVRPNPAPAPEPLRPSPELQQSFERLRTGLTEIGGQVQKMSSQLQDVAAKTEQLSVKVGQSAGKAEQLATKVDQSTSKAAEAVSKAEQLAARVDQSTSKAAEAVSKAEQLAARVDQSTSKAAEAVSKAEQLAVKVDQTSRAAEAVSRTEPSLIRPEPVLGGVEKESSPAEPPAPAGAAPVAAAPAVVPVANVGSAAAPLAVVAAPAAPPRRSMSRGRKVALGVLGGLTAAVLGTTLVLQAFDGRPAPLERCGGGPGSDCRYRFAPAYTTAGYVLTGLLGAALLGTAVYPYEHKGE